MGSIGNPGAKLTVFETQVFNGTSPTTWADLDLSAVVGANPALVVLKIAGGTGGKSVSLRKNGDTDDFYNIAAAESYGLALLSATTSAVHLATAVATGPLGKIEWKTETAETYTMDIIAYVK